MWTDLKRESDAWGYNWATLALGWTQIQRSRPPGRGLDSRLTTLLCNKIIVAKSKKVKSAWCTEEGYGSTSSVFPMMVVVVVVVTVGLDCMISQNSSLSVIIHYEWHTNLCETCAVHITDIGRNAWNVIVKRPIRLSYTFQNMKPILILTGKPSIMINRIMVYLNSSTGILGWYLERTSTASFQNILL
jgi:hypothetical protein